MPIFLLLILLSSTALAVEPIRVCATVPDLGELAHHIGGDDLVVTVFARGSDDPHFIDARPSFSKALAQAHLLVVVGLELEIGWLPVLQKQARNIAINCGSDGYIDASTAIDPLGIPLPGTDRSHGDVHAGGNPHYLSDPVNGLKVARLIADRLIALSPDHRERFEMNWEIFAKRMALALFGQQRAMTITANNVITLAEQETLHPSLLEDGWFGALQTVRGQQVIADHDLWSYFMRRFSIRISGFLEPKPGIAPTTEHLSKIIDMMKTQHIRAIVTTPYFDKRHAELVAKHANAMIIPLAHQVGSLPSASDYFSTIDHNVHALKRYLSSQE